MGQKEKDYIVISVSEEGYTDVYGPYTHKNAERVMEEIYMDDSGQKTHVNVERLRKYEPIQS